MYSFEYWLNEIADIPMRDADGNWYDAETGLYYSDLKTSKKVRTTISAPALAKRNIAKSFGGKALRGTKKQKEWAEKLRASTLQKIDRESAELLVKSNLASHAKFWIENRDKSPSEFTRFIKMQKELLSEFNSTDESCLSTREKLASEYNALMSKWGVCD